MNALAIAAKTRRDAALVAAACRRIEQAEVSPSLDALARAAGLSPHHFHRIFKAITGVTPKAYAQAQRGKALRTALAKPGAKVTDALFDAGFNASSRFYDSADGLLGMKPAQYRRGGADAREQRNVGAVTVWGSRLMGCNRFRIDPLWPFNFCTNSCCRRYSYHSVERRARCRVGGAGEL